MTIESIMTRNLVTVDMDAPVATVRDLFNTHGFHHLLVMNGEKPVGVITDRDLLANISPFLGKPTERSQDHFLLERRAHQIMSRTMVPVRVGEEIKVAMGLMMHHRCSCVFVCDESGRPQGIVTWHDFLTYSLECGVEPGCSITRGDVRGNKRAA